MTWMKLARKRFSLRQLGEVVMTIHLDLDEKEAALLHRVLHNRYDELSLEIRHSRDFSSKEYLKLKQRLLRRVLGKFPEGLDTKAHWEGYRPEL